MQVQVDFSKLFFALSHCDALLIQIQAFVLTVGPLASVRGPLMTTVWPG